MTWLSSPKIIRIKLPTYYVLISNHRIQINIEGFYFTSTPSVKRYVGICLKCHKSWRGVSHFAIKNTIGNPIALPCEISEAEHKMKNLLR